MGSEGFCSHGLGQPDTLLAGISILDSKLCSSYILSPSPITGVAFLLREPHRNAPGALEPPANGHELLIKEKVSVVLGVVPEQAASTKNFTAASAIASISFSTCTKNARLRRVLAQ